MRWLLPVTAPAMVIVLVWLRAGVPHPAVPARRPHRDAAAPALSAPVWAEQLIVATGHAVDPVVAGRVIRRAIPVTLVALAILIAPGTALLAAIGLLIAPRAIPRLLRRRLLDRRDAQLPGALEQLASTVRAGGALGPGLVEIAVDAPEPLGTELRTVAAEIEHGAAMAAAVERWAARPEASAAVRLTAAALSLGGEVGGEVARSIDRVAATLRERRALQAEAHSLATQARASAVVLGLAPLAFAVLVSSIEPRVVHFLGATPGGWLCLGSGLMLEAAGVAWMGRIVRGAT